MKNILGAQRPASSRHILGIAVAAIVLVLALATAAFSQGYGSNWFGMGSDNVMGMMPPSMGVPQPTAQPHQSGAALMVQSHGNAPALGPNCAAAANLTLVQAGSGQTYTYVSTKHGCVYTISRNGKAWLTVTYDGTYKITDPNGTGKLVLELGIAPGQFPGPKGNPHAVKLTPPPPSTH